MVFMGIVSKFRNVESLVYVWAHGLQLDEKTLVGKILAHDITLVPNIHAGSINGKSFNLN